MSKPIEPKSGTAAAQFGGHHGSSSSSKAKPNTAASLYGPDRMIDSEVPGPVGKGVRASASLIAGGVALSWNNTMRALGRIDDVLAKFEKDPSATQFIIAALSLFIKLPLQTAKDVLTGFTEKDSKGNAISRVGIFGLLNNSRKFLKDSSYAQGGKGGGASAKGGLSMVEEVEQREIVEKALKEKGLNDEQIQQFGKDMEVAGKDILAGPGRIKEKTVTSAVTQGKPKGQSAVVEKKPEQKKTRPVRPHCSAMVPPSRG